VPHGDVFRRSTYGLSLVTIQLGSRKDGRHRAALLDVKHRAALLDVKVLPGGSTNRGRCHIGAEADEASISHALQPWDIEAIFVTGYQP
jgi:hypothetical protein